MSDDQWRDSRNTQRTNDPWKHSREMGQKVDSIFNDAMAQIVTGDGKWEGLNAWVPPVDQRCFGVDRDRPYAWPGPPPPLTLRARIVGAWRGMVRGWSVGDGW